MQGAQHWHEKPCKECGAIIRCRDDWGNIPNYCKNCKDRLEINTIQRRKAVESFDDGFSFK